MSKEAFDQIAEGLQEAIAIARGEDTPARIHVPSRIDVRTIRARTGNSQEGFAVQYGFTVGQVRDWEQGRSQPTGAMRLYLSMIAHAPEEVARILAAVSRSGGSTAHKASLPEAFTARVENMRTVINDPSASGQDILMRARELLAAGTAEPKVRARAAG